MEAFQPSGLKGKCKLRDKLPCVMMRHESKGRTSGTDYICASCAKKRPIALLWIRCIRSWHQSSAVMAVTRWPGGSESSCSSYPNYPASPLALWTVCLLKHMFRLSSHVDQDLSAQLNASGHWAETRRPSTLNTHVCFTRLGWSQSFSHFLNTSVIPLLLTLQISQFYGNDLHNGPYSKQLNW